MIIRVSAKLGKKIHVAPAKSLPPHVNPFADWSAHLFTADRTQYILITNTASLYSMVMYGKGITDDSTFLQRAVSLIGEVLRDDGHGFIFERLIAPISLAGYRTPFLGLNAAGALHELVSPALADAHPFANHGVR